MSWHVTARPFPGLLCLWCIVLAMYRAPVLMAQEPMLRTTLKCDQEVHCLAISPDGKTLAAGVGDGTARLWDLTTSKPSGVLKEGNWPVMSLAFGKEGKTLAQGTGVGLGNDYLTLWDIPSQKKAKTYLSGRTGGAIGVFSLTFSKDGTLLLATTDGAIRVWDVTKEKEPRCLTAEGFEQLFISVALSSDGKTVVAAHGYREAAGPPAVVVWDLPSGKSTVFKELKGNQFAVAISPDGKTVAVTGAEGIAVHMLDLASKKTRVFKGAKGSATFSVAFSPDGKTVAVGTGYPDQMFNDGEKREVQLWNVATGKRMATLQGHKKTIQSLVFSPDGSILATADSHGTIHLWEVNGAKKSQR